MRQLITFSFLHLVSLIALHARILDVPDAYPTITAAIEAAEHGDTILLAPGTYAEHIDFTGKNVVLSSAYLINGDPEMIAQTVIDGGGTAPTISLTSGETAEAQVIGLTITGGGNVDTGVFTNAYGGGIICVDASPTIRNNIIRDCTNSVFNYSDFGGVYCERSEATILDNQIAHITGFFTEKLGGVAANGSNLTIKGNTISDISGGYVFFGGGIAADSSILRIERNVIDSCAYDLYPIYATVKIRKSAATLLNNTLLGALGIQDTCTVSVSNNIIFNSAFGPEGGIVEMNQSSVIYTNLSYNLYPGAPEDNGNLDTDPLFVGAASGDYRLSTGSPCIDAGDPMAPADPDATRADIGALYFSQTTATTDPFTMQGRLYPNPTSDWIGIDGQFDWTRIEIIAMDGSVHPICQLDPGHRISVDGLPGGMYLLRAVDSAGQMLSGIFVKQ